MLTLPNLYIKYKFWLYEYTIVIYIRQNIHNNIIPILLIVLEPTKEFSIKLYQ